MVERTTPEIQWRLHSCFGRDRMEGQAVARFAEDVENRTDGRLMCAIYAFGTSGVLDPDLLQAVSGGDLEMATLYSEYFIRDAPALALCYAQGVLESPEDHWRAFPAVAAIYRETFDDWNIETVGALARPVYDACVFAPEPVDSLVALGGRTIRVWSRHQVAAFARLGISAVIVPQNAMVEAFRDGIIDCALYMAEAAGTTDLALAAPYHSSLHPFSAIPNVIGANRKAWGRLPEDLQGAVAEAGRAIAEETLAQAMLNQARGPAGAPQARAGGLQAEFHPVAPFPEADRRRFREASRAAWADLAEAAGPDAVAARARVLAALGF